MYINVCICIYVSLGCLGITVCLHPAGLHCALLAGTSLELKTYVPGFQNWEKKIFWVLIADTSMHTHRETLMHTHRWMKWVFGFTYMYFLPWTKILRNSWWQLQFSSWIVCIVYIGVPEEVIKRAAFILEALGNNEHVERLCNENVSAQDQQYQVSTPKQNLRFRYETWNYVE